MKCVIIKESVDILDETVTNLEDSIAIIIQRVQEFVSLHGVKHGGHIFIPRLDSFINRHDGYSSNNSSSNNSNNSSKAIAKMILILKNIIHGTKISLFISFQPHCIDSGSSGSGTTSIMSNTKLSGIITALADTWLTVESFAGKESQVPSDFKLFCGYLHLRRIQQVYSIAPSHRPSNCRFGIKRDRRKLHIESLHLPPEESRAMQSSNAINTRTITTNNNSGIGSNNSNNSSGNSKGVSCHPSSTSKLEF